MWIQSFDRTQRLRSHYAPNNSQQALIIHNSELIAYNYSTNYSCVRSSFTTVDYSHTTIPTNYLCDSSSFTTVNYYHTIVSNRIFVHKQSLPAGTFVRSYLCSTRTFVCKQSFPTRVNSNYYCFPAGIIHCKQQHNSVANSHH